jgi:hypothetical protein
VVSQKRMKPKRNAKLTTLYHMGRWGSVTFCSFIVLPMCIPLHVCFFFFSQYLHSSVWGIVLRRMWYYLVWFINTWGLTSNWTDWFCNKILLLITNMCGHLQNNWLLTSYMYSYVWSLHQNIAGNHFLEVPFRTVVTFVWMSLSDSKWA